MSFLKDILDRIFGKPKPVPPPIFDNSTQMLIVLNDMRKKAGVGPLQEDKRLSVSAQRHAVALSIGRIKPHAGFPDRVWSTGFPQQQCGAKSGFGNISEGIAMGDAPIQKILGGLMDGAGHQRDLTDPIFNLVGLGWAIDRDGRWIYVIDYGVICQ